MLRLKFRLNLDIDESLLIASSFHLSKDTLFICGSSDFLGNWNLNKAVEMKYTSVNLSEHMSCLSTSCSSLSSNSSWDATIYENNNAANW